MTVCASCGYVVPGRRKVLRIVRRAPERRSTGSLRRHARAARLFDRRRQPADGAHAARARPEVYAEAGKMVYKTPNVAWGTRMTGQTLSDKLLGALRRTLTGESVFVTYFHANGPGEVEFAGSIPAAFRPSPSRPGRASWRSATRFSSPSRRCN